MSGSDPEWKKCTRCGAYKLPDAFGIRQKDSSTGGRKGEPTSKCASCMEDDRRYKRNKNKNKRKCEEDPDLAVWTEGGDEEGQVRVKTVTIEEFLARLGSCVRSNAASSQSASERKAGVFKFAERVDCRSMISTGKDTSDGKDTSGLRGRADGLVKLVERETKWRWTYENTRPRARRGDTVFSYSCAQSDAREAAPKIPPLGRKSRNRKRMERFPCNGWLFVAVAPGDPVVVVVRIGHEVGHCRHKDVDADVDVVDHGDGGEEGQAEVKDEDETVVPTA